MPVVAALCLAQNTGITLRALIAKAWGVKASRVAGGPEWLNSEPWNIEAGTEDSRALQALLKERFGLAVHREARRVPVYNLTSAAGGIRLKPSDCAAGCGKVEVRRGRVDAAGIRMPEFSKVLAGILERPVIDRTGFAGSFDVHFDYLPDDAVDATGPDASLFVVLEEKLGLKLESGRGPVEMLIVDRAQRPRGPEAQRGTPRDSAR